MRRALLMVIFGLPIPACTSFSPVEKPADRILSEGLLEPGDEVRVVTDDGNVHEFRVDEVNVGQGRLVGTQETVLVAKVVAIEKRAFSPMKTGILVGGLVLGILGSDCEDDCNEFGGFMCC
jgi:hypothetical protein